MRRREFVLIGLLVSAVPMLAQSPGSKQGKGAKPDSITGTWTGELAPRSAPRPAQVTMALKFDGKSAVTGTFSGMPSPGDVKAGSFDPKTGALKLELGKAGESAVLLVLEGTVVKGTASGKVTGDGGSGEFKLTKKP